MAGFGQGSEGPCPSVPDRVLPTVFLSALGLPRHSPCLLNSSEQGRELWDQLPSAAQLSFQGFGLHSLAPANWPRAVLPAEVTLKPHATLPSTLEVLCSIILPVSF